MIYDVIVAGGGPAGAAAARECAGAGLSTVVLEKDYYPREKTCAGGVSSAAQKVIGVPIPPELVEARCSSFRGHFGTRVVEVKLPKDFVAVVSRDLFDQWLISLARAAGAEVRQGERVRKVEGGAKGVTVQTESSTYKGRILIGADGVNSTVARAVRPPLKKNEMSFCVCSEIKAADIKRNEIEIHHGPMPLSYCWLFPKREAVSVGFGGWISGNPGILEAYRDFLAGRGFPAEVRVRGKYIPIGGLRRPTVADGIILTGDAAGFADPLTGEGIRYALISGRIAARVAIPLIQAGLPLRAERLALYDDLCRMEFGRKLQAALLIARSFGRFPRLLQFLFFNRPEPFQKLL